MSPVEISSAQQKYNQVAINCAEKVQRAKRQHREQNANTDRSVASLFPARNRSGLGIHLEYAQMGNRPVTAELQARAEQFGVRFEHLGLTLGTVLHDIDLHQPQSAELIQFIRDTLLERKVIFFRNQNLSEDEQVAFANRFGDLDAFPFGKPGDNPYVLEIVHGEDSPGTENGWHTDVTWMEKPSLGSIAQCVVVPPTGGDTLFADSYASYLGLPEALQERLQHLHGVHDYRVFMAGRGTGKLPDELIEEIKKDIPFGVSHPLLRTHPETGKTALYLHGGFLRHDSLHNVSTGEPLDSSEAKAIVGVLLQQHNNPEYHCRFQWQAGSMAFWDNRAVQHYAASDYYPHERVLRRVTISGDKPFYKPEAR